MGKGLYLYYGFKLTEKTMIDTFFDLNFRKYVEELFSTKPELIPRFDENNKVEYIGWEIRDLVSMYYDKYFFGENGRKSQIKICYIKCCQYDSDSNWIIGIKVCHVDAFKDKIQRVDGQLIQQDSINELNKIKNKFKLPGFGPLFYSIPSNCWICT